MIELFNLSLSPRQLIAVFFLILLLALLGLSNAPYRDYLKSGSVDGLEMAGQRNDANNLAKQTATATNDEQLQRTVSKIQNALLKKKEKID